MHRYIPKAQLRYEYPGEYLEEDVQPCEGADQGVKEEAQKYKTKPCRRKQPMKKSKRQSSQEHVNDPTENESFKKSKQPQVKGSDKVT